MKGKRVRLNAAAREWGIGKYARDKAKPRSDGTIVGSSLDGTCWRVKWDNRSHIDTINKRFVTEITDGA